jgi:hypothetical protein
MTRPAWRLPYPGARYGLGARFTWMAEICCRSEGTARGCSRTRMLAERNVIAGEKRPADGPPLLPYQPPNVLAAQLRAAVLELFPPSRFRAGCRRLLGCSDPIQI